MSAVLQPTDTPSAQGVGDEPEAVPDEGAPREKKKTKIDPIAAAKRLAESRERMRQWMVDPDGRQAARRQRALAAGETPGESKPLLERLRSNPLVGMFVDVANSWWTRHPLHTVFTLAEDEVRGRIAPIARRHPLAVVASAVAVGAAVVWFRPWRWLKGPAQAAGTASHWMLRLLGSVPIASLVAAYTAAAKTRAEADEATEDAAPHPPAGVDAAPPVPAEATLH